jgi:general secretion pathway protein K
MSRLAAPARQRGVALITAILIVALGTIIAASFAYDNALTARRAQGAFALDQSLQIAEAGEAIAAYALRETRKVDRAHVYPGQPWSMPYGPVEVVPGVTLEAGLEDMQGRFNLNNLVDQSGKIDPVALEELQNLLQSLGLETKWASLIADWIDADSIAVDADGAEDNTYLSQVPPYRTANMPITSASELLALPGFGRDRYLLLAQFVTALPQGTRINLCSAKRQLIDALIGPGHQEYSAIDATSFAKTRSEGCHPTQQEFDASFNGDQDARSKADLKVGTASDYFQLMSIVNVGTTQFALYSLLHQEGDLRVRPIQRSYTAD